MSGTKRVHCHIYDIAEASKAGAELETTCIKDYGEETIVDGVRLHYNYEAEDGWRALMRCKKCGALFLVQHSSYEAMDSDYDGSFYDWIPVWSDEEADLMNILMDARDLPNVSIRHLRKNNGAYFWMGKGELKAHDLAELRMKVEEGRT